MEAPSNPSFDLQDPYAQKAAKKCRGFTFQQTVAPALLHSASTIECEANKMTITVKGLTNDYYYPRDNPIQFVLNTVNPATTPYMFTNFWKITHYSSLPPAGISEDDRVKLIVESAVQESWQILPQLANVKVDLVGQMKAASASSEIKLTFTSVSAADELSIVAASPDGFDFTPGEDYEDMIFV
jgi:hypothetical protein